MEENIKIFHDYAYEFDQNVYMIHYKYEHSLRVMKNSEFIAKSLKLDDEDIYLAKFIGLMHDIGRFRQWTEHNTYDDNISIDHAQEAINILFNEKLIEKFNIDKKHYNIIKEAISNHNKFEINRNLSDKKILIHAKIIRDADKLDILYAFSGIRLLELKSDNSSVSDSIRENFYNHKQTNTRKINTINDRVIELISLVYDLNFKCSFKYLKEKNHINHMYNSLKNKQLLNNYFDEINSFIDERNE